MGYSSWSTEAYRSVTDRRSGAAAGELFRETASVDPRMDPRQLTVREARDSEAHPHSTPLVVGFDVTASMGHIPEDFARVQLGRLMTLLSENGWIRDPQVLFAAYGDAVSDRGPLQVGQFESGLEMDLWLTRIWLEGGGGDIPESTTLVHWFAAHRTATDAWEKRGEKGFLFTIGDAPNKELKDSHLRRVFGGRPEAGGADPEVLAAVQERWECWHVLVPSGRDIREDARVCWEGLLGTNLLICRDHRAICELIGVVVGLRQGRLDPTEGARVLTGAGLRPDEVEAVLRAVAG